MEKVKPRTLSGFMELLPAPQVQMERIMQVLRETYALYGFYPLDTPLIESSEVLLAKGGGETEKQIYRFTKGDSDLSLRFDLTVPLAKYVAQHYGELTFPFRRFQIGKVYRGERAQRGRFREFYQADIDVIGDGKLDIINEAEVPSIIYKTFTSLGLQRFKIRINNRKVLNGFFAILGLTEKAGDVMRTIDKLEKIGAEKVKTILVEDFGVEAATADELLKFIETPGGTEGILAALDSYKGKNEVFDLGAEELKTVANYMTAFGVPADHFEIDLTIARGLDYYTGTVYETAMLDHPEIGSICSGGRYDNLAEYYTDKHRPDPSVLRSRRAGLSERPDEQGPGGRSHSADDRRHGRSHRNRDRPARFRYPHPALRRAEEVQAQDRLRRQARHSVRYLPRRGRNQCRRGRRQGYGVR